MVPEPHTIVMQALSQPPGWKLVWRGINCAEEWLDRCQNISWTTIHSPEPTFMTLNYHTLNLKGLFICSRPGNNDYHVYLPLTRWSLYYMGWGLSNSTPLQKGQRDRSRVYWKTNYQLIVYSTPPPPSVSGVNNSSYLSNCQWVHLCLYCNGYRYFHGKWKQVAITYIRWTIIRNNKIVLSVIWGFMPCEANAYPHLNHDYEAYENEALRLLFT